MVKPTAFEAPPPGEGLTTVIALEPADAMSAAVILAVTWVELTTVTVRAAASHCTVAPETKFTAIHCKSERRPTRYCSCRAQ